MTAYHRHPPTARLRVLQVVEAVDEGGVKRHVLSIVRSLDRDRFEVEVAGPAVRAEKGEGESFVAEMSAQGVRFYPIEMQRSVSPARDLLALVQLIRLMRRGRYHIVHGHSSKAGVLARIAGWLARTPTVYTPNALYFLRFPRGVKRSLYLAFERMAGPFTSRFVAVSQSEKQVALRERLVPEEKIVVIPNGIEPDTFARPAHSPVRAELGIPDDAIVVGTAARLSVQKDPECLIRAMREVIARSERPVYLIWAGDGELAAEAKRVVRECGIEGSCRLIGFRHDIRAVMSAFDVFALGSRYEGLPYAVLEAMALRLPVVATDVVGVRDVVVDGGNGYLVPRGDPRKLADALGRLVHDEALRTQLGEQGRRTVEERFRLSVMTRRIEALYCDLAKRPYASMASEARAVRGASVARSRGSS